MYHFILRIFFTVFTTALISLSGFAQSKRQFTQLKPVNATGEVISVFEGTTNIALLKITKADTAKANFDISENEILCTFQFGTKPSTGDPKLPGINAGDIIRMELFGSRDSDQSPWDYRVFRYWLIKENPSSQEGGKSQK